MSTRWLDADEFRQGERRNPYPPDLPAVRCAMSAVPDGGYGVVSLLGIIAVLVRAANRRRNAVSGSAWMPVTVVERARRRRQVRRALRVTALVLLVLLATRNGVVVLAEIFVVVVGLPVAGRAVRDAGATAHLDQRTGQVGVDDGERNRRRT
jgi:hypothetical protein